MKPPSGLFKNETLDTLFRGRLAVIQKRTGYRFSLDAVLLADFVTVRKEETVMDLGSGNGVVSLILAFLHPAANISSLEIQPEMVERARRSATLNRLEDRVKIFQGDVCSVQPIFSRRSFDVVVCNPPYRRLATGRMNPDPERQLARHEVKGRLSDFLRAGSYLLRRKGRMAVVYPAARLLDALQLMRQEDIEPKRLRLVHSFENAPATLGLVEGIVGARSGLEVMAPLVVYARVNEYGAEMSSILRQ